MRHSRSPLGFRLALVVAALLTFATLLVAFTATNTVPSTRAGQSLQATGAADVEPAVCKQNGVVATAIIGGVANSTVNGTNGDDLMLADSGASETLNGVRGNDCLVAGSGGDTLVGGSGGGTNVCVKNGNTNVTTKQCTVVAP
jgi:Ca2+-binding RTX toxin-like protein